MVACAPENHEPLSMQFVGKPTPGWNGTVDCEVIEVREPTLLRYSWRGSGDVAVTGVA